MLVLLQFVGLVTSGEIGVHSITDALPSVADRFAPLFLHDHVVALYASHPAAGCVQLALPAVSALDLHAFCGILA